MTALFELGVAQVAFWWIAATVAVAAWWVYFGGQHRNPQHDRELAWWLWHWFTGAPLETMRAYPGGGGRPRRLARRTGRGTGRAALAAGVVAALYLRSGAPQGTGPGTVATWGLAGALALAVVTVLVARAAVEWSMWRHYVEPLHWAIAEAAGWKLDMPWWQVRRYIHIPRGMAASGDGVIVVVGPTFRITSDVEEKLVGVIIAKLGLSDVSVGWKREGLHRYVQLQHQEPVPAKVPFRLPNIRELIEAESTPSRVFVGLGRGGTPYWLDLDRKAPHMLMSAGTGSGKSVALTSLVAQLMWHGAEVVVMDFKRMSLLWLRDMAGVRYARDIEEIHQAAIDLGAEVERRTAAWDRVTFEEREAGKGPVFPRLVIVCEEWSSTMDELRDHWKDIRASSDPQRSPAVKAMARVLNMGRVLHMNVLTVCQRAEANAVGNGAMRENYPVKFMIDRYSKQTWNILAPECGYVPGVAHTGRAQVCLGATATEVQLLWMTEQEAWKWVRDKRGLQPRQPARQPLVPVGGDMPVPGEMDRDCPGTGTDQGVPPVTLWEASSDMGVGIVTLKYETLRRTAQRERKIGAFPEPVDHRGDAPEFDPFDLQRWELHRPINRKAGASDGVAGRETSETNEVGRTDDNENADLAEDGSEGYWLQPEASRRDSDRDRFYALVAPANEAGCRLWTGAVNGDGYGYFKVDGRAVPAHRFAFEDQIGPIPAGHTIDHLVGPDEPCTSNLCMTGGHLEAVTNEENVSRRWERQRAEQGASQ